MIVAHANIAGLLTTGVVNDTAGPTSASTRVANPAAALTGRVGVAARSVTSSCSFNTNIGAVTGTVTITNGHVTVAGVPTTTLAANPAPNTTITVPGVV